MKIEIADQGIRIQSDSDMCVWNGNILWCPELDGAQLYRWTIVATWNYHSDGIIIAPTIVTKG